MCFLSLAAPVVTSGRLNHSLKTRTRKNDLPFRGWGTNTKYKSIVQFQPAPDSLKSNQEAKQMEELIKPAWLQELIEKAVEEDKEMEAKNQENFDAEITRRLKNMGLDLTVSNSAVDGIKFNPVGSWSNELQIVKTCGFCGKDVYSIPFIKATDIGRLVMKFKTRDRSHQDGFCKNCGIRSGSADEIRFLDALYGILPFPEE